MFALSKVRTPTSVQTSKISQTEPSCAATAPGERKIPTPIVPPMTTEMPKPTPRMRSSFPFCKLSVSLMLLITLHFN